MRAPLVAALLFGGAVACGKPPASAQRAMGPAQARQSTAEGRERVSITVYNGNFGLVREVRDVDLALGKVALEFRDVAAHIQPETVHIKSLSSPSALDVYEQNYRYDLLTPEKLLEKYVGKHVKLHRYNKELGTEEDFDAEVLAADGTSPPPPERGPTLGPKAPVFRVNGEVTYGFDGRISFPDVPANLIAKPTLVLLLGVGEARQKIEVTYVTNELSWASDYVLTIDDKDASGDIVGWVTLTNHSGASYENAELKLVAGDVQRVQRAMGNKKMFEPAPADKDREEGFKEEGLFEYHLYTLGRPTTLLDNEQKQVTLLEGHGIGVDKRLIFWGQQYWYRSRVGQVMTNQKVGVYLDIENSEKNHLGMPLPKGIVRVYKADSSGAKQFVGEDNIDHTPRDEKIRIKMGEAFDVVGDRKQTSWKTLGACASESDWEIALRNHKDLPQAVEDVEPVEGDWEIVSASHEAKKKDAHTFVFDVNVPARGEVKITYRVRVRWC
jgi:hypothetical protein